MEDEEYVQPFVEMLRATVNAYCSPLKMSVQELKSENARLKEKIGRIEMENSSLKEKLGLAKESFQESTKEFISLGQKPEGSKEDEALGLGDYSTNKMTGRGDMGTRNDEIIPIAIEDDDSEISNSQGVQDSASGLANAIKEDTGDMRSITILDNSEGSESQGIKRKSDDGQENSVKKKDGFSEEFVLDAVHARKYKKQCACPECLRIYKSLVEKGQSDKARDFLMNSRHRNDYTPPESQEEMWNFDISDEKG